MSAAVRALGTQSPWAPFTAFGAGLATSIGPCTAPRMLAAANLARDAGGARKHVGVAALVLGLVFGYVGVALISQPLVERIGNATLTYALVSLLMLVAGIRLLWSSPSHACAVSCRRKSFGGAFVLGATFPFVASPCCSPFLVLFAGAAASDWFASIEAIAAFALGHAVPLLVVGFGARSIADFVVKLDLRVAVQTVAGALSIALGAYYGLLA